MRYHHGVRCALNEFFAQIHDARIRVERRKFSVNQAVDGGRGAHEPSGCRGIVWAYNNTDPLFFGEGQDGGIDR